MNWSLLTVIACIVEFTIAGPIKPAKLQNTYPYVVDNYQPSYTQPSGYSARPSTPDMLYQVNNNPAGSTNLNDQYGVVPGCLQGYPGGSMNLDYNVDKAYSREPVGTYDDIEYDSPTITIDNSDIAGPYAIDI